MNSGKVALGVLAGVAAGAILGILFAPAKGSETRQKIAGKGDDMKDALKDKFDEFMNTITEKIEKVKEDIDAFSDSHSVETEEKKKA